MQVLVGYESSGVVREAFRARGHDAWSCDLLPADDQSPHHFQNDVRNVIGYEAWDLVILHPDCTYLTVSAAWAFKDPDFDRYPGVGYHQKVKPETLTGSARRAAREKALEEICWLMGCGLTYCIENPATSFISKAIRPPDQVIHPHWFGDDASKATGLWFNQPEDFFEHHIPRLPDLLPTRHVPGRVVNGKERWANQTDSGQNRETPGCDRWKRRARTYPGVAAAMAVQWGSQKGTIMKSHILRALAEKQPLWQGVARRPREQWGRELRDAEASGLLEIREGGFWITSKGREVAHEGCCPHCKKPL